MRASNNKPKSARRPRRYGPGAVNTSLVAIGNSRGVRLPKPMIEQAGLKDKVHLRVQGTGIIIEPLEEADPCAGWEEQIKRVAAEFDDKLDTEWLDAPMNTEFDDKEWTW